MAGQALDVAGLSLATTTGVLLRRARSVTLAHGIERAISYSAEVAELRVGGLDASADTAKDTLVYKGLTNYLDGVRRMPEAPAEHAPF